MKNEDASVNAVCDRIPLIGDPAPKFRAMTTMGKVNFPGDYQGKWVILFSHPADFTPVCTTEFITFAKMADEFKSLNTELIGLSIDSLHSHLAWAKSIEEVDWNGNGYVKLPFPIIADISMSVAKKYGINFDKVVLADVKELVNKAIQDVIDGKVVVPTAIGEEKAEGKDKTGLEILRDSLQP